jgi:hypothetical protein
VLPLPAYDVAVLIDRQKTLLEPIALVIKLSYVDILEVSHRYFNYFHSPYLHPPSRSRHPNQIAKIFFLLGAWAARYLALIISVIGLPKWADSNFFTLLDKHCDRDPSFQSVFCPELLEYDSKFLANHY